MAEINEHAGVRPDGVDEGTGQAAYEKKREDGA